ncbi:MAG: transcription termination/antitermination protein NusG [Planctomycetota bacterium]
MKQWYVLRVQTNREEKVRDALQTRVRAAGLDEEISDILVPTEKVSEIKSGKKTISEHKIYPGYVFVEMELSEQTMAVVKNCPGIGDFLGASGEATPLSDREVEKVTAEAESKEEAPTLKIDFDPGDNIRITEGAFKNFEGTVDDVLPEKGLLRVVVTIFGRPTPVELEYWQVERT